jgi:hypothetical protein
MAAGNQGLEIFAGFLESLAMGNKQSTTLPRYSAMP